MDRTKTKLKNCIFKAVTKELIDLEFRKTKSTFWAKECANTIQFIHIHTLSFDYSFRIHLGIRVKNDSFDAASLNGPSSKDGWWESKKVFKRRRELGFSDGQNSIDNCSASIVEFVNEIGTKWFKEFIDETELLTNLKSPINNNEKRALRDALSGKGNPEHEELSKRIIGLK